MIADGNHARVDGFVSLGVVGSAIIVALGAQIGDPIIGLAITLVILRITWQSWRDGLDDRPGRDGRAHEHWPSGRPAVAFGRASGGTHAPRGRREDGVRVLAWPAWVSRRRSSPRPASSRALP